MPWKALKKLITRPNNWASSGQFESPERKTKTNGMHDWFALPTIEFVSGSEKVASRRFRSRERLRVFWFKRRERDTERNREEETQGEPESEREATMITRSNLAEQLREYQIRSKHDWASVSFFSSTSSNIATSRYALPNSYSSYVFFFLQIRNPCPVINQNPHFIYHVYYSTHGIAIS